MEDDLSRSHALSTHPGGFEEVLRRYTELDDLTSTRQWPQFLNHARDGVYRGELYLAGESGSRFLEVGCRSGGALIAASRNYREVWGIDIAHRWLVVARRRMEEAGVDANLACCSADALPFRSGYFDCVYQEDTLQHTDRQVESLQESDRVLCSDGRLLLTIWNRFCPLPEPHVNLWGVGYLPSKFRQSYVRIRANLAYHIHLLSASQLRNLIARLPSIKYSLEAGPLASRRLDRAGWPVSQLSRLYERLRKKRWLGKLLQMVAPTLVLRGRKV